MLREEYNHIDQNQMKNARFRMEKDEILTTTVINRKEQRKQRPSFGVDILFIGICILGLGSRHPGKDFTLFTLSCWS